MNKKGIIQFPHVKKIHKYFSFSVLFLILSRDQYDWPSVKLEIFPILIPRTIFVAHTEEHFLIYLDVRGWFEKSPSILKLLANNLVIKIAIYINL